MIKILINFNLLEIIINLFVLLFSIKLEYTFKIKHLIIKIPWEKIRESNRN